MTERKKYYLILVYAVLLGIVVAGCIRFGGQKLTAPGSEELEGLGEGIEGAITGEEELLGNESEITEGLESITEEFGELEIDDEELESLLAEIEGLLGAGIELDPEAELEIDVNATTI